jgi:hypothetical protein
MGASIQLFAACLARGRVRFAPRPGQSVRDNIRHLVPRNKKDQVVLGAAAGSKDKVLISNDESDFSNSVRKKALSQLKVTILHSEDIDPQSEPPVEELIRAETEGAAEQAPNAPANATE